MKRTANGEGTFSIKRKKLNATERVELGKIESVSLRNFMCHDNFEFKFAPQMNFIIGQNGSGKSAILTGLILALGGKSSITGRYPNIKGFVKTGKQKAKIEVVLYNSGPLAYKPEIYGGKITVIREISTDGASSYKLKSETGHIVSHLKEELNNVLNAMDIQVDNPVQILTQETSRNFLLSKHATGERLYQFFYKGTGLQELQENYCNIMSMKEEAAADLERKQKALPEMEKELRRWKKFLDSSAKISDYKNELLWAGVIEMEKIFQRKELDYTNVDKEIASHKDQMEKCKAVFNEKTLELEEYTKKRGECDASMTEYRKTLEKLKTERENCATSLRKHEGVLALYKREERKIADDMQGLENCINENRQKNQNDIKEEERKRQQEIEKLQQENLNVNAALEDLKKKRGLKMDEQNELQRNIDFIVADIASHDYRQRKIGEELNRARVALKNKVNVFGDQTQNVLNDISRRKSDFRHLPKGPIGIYLEVKDPKWSAAIEKSVSVGLLRSYCVDNHQDDKLLKEILRKHYKHYIPSTIVCPYSQHVHDVTVHKAQSSYPTVLDMLKIKDVQVANALIDQASIESNILVEDVTVAQNLMMDYPPNNCYSAYTLACDQVYPKPSFRIYSQGRQKQSCMLSSMRQDDINHLEESLRIEKAECEIKKANKLQLHNRLEQFPVDLKKLDHQIVRLSIMEKDNLEKIKDLDCMEEPKDVYCMQGDLQQLQQEHEKKEMEINSCQIEVSKYREEMEKILKEMESRKTLLQTEKAKFDDFGAKITECGQCKEIVASGKKKYESEFKACENKLKCLKTNLEEARQLTQLAVSNAEETCPRIDTDRSANVIRRQLAETERVVEEQSNCDREELHRKYIEKLKTLKEAKIELKKRESYIVRIDEMLKLRRSKFRDIQKQTQICVDMAFTCILHGNGYTGNLAFSVKNQTLTLNVAPKKGLSAYKTHKTLSGGERSFVTISFLLALWERTHMPFRILDEYDVFMDSNNRQLSVDLLIRKAEEMQKAQFIFLSPLDLPQIKSSEHVKIHKMMPPKRIKDLNVSSS